MYRIGIGFDIHRFPEDKSCISEPLVVGQVEFPSHPRLEGASLDVDVLLHAVSDAILGAAGMPDIGTIFPPSEGKKVSSKEIIQNVKARVSKNYRIVNVDCVLIAQEPKMGDKIPKMKENIRKILGCDVNVRVKSPEKIGDLGRGQGIAAFAVVLLKRKIGGRGKRSK